MKKYKMKIKDDNAEYNWYNFNGKHDISIGYVWLSDSCSYSYDYSHSSSKTSGKIFTFEEIKKMPYGFVNQYDLIEVKEQLYYVELPHFTNPYCYLSEEEESGIVSSADKDIVRGYKTKFTKQEIEEKFPFYANDTCMVKVELEGVE